VLVTNLLCREIVLRAIRKRGWLDEDGRIRVDAYIWDPERDPDGLSVNMQSMTDIDKWLDEWLTVSFKKSFGADSLHTGRVRDLKLEIGQTKEDISGGRGHAVIVGLPSVEEDNKRAEDLATLLRDISRSLDRVVRSKKA